MPVRRPNVGFPELATGRRGEINIIGIITVGASGAVTSVACEYAPLTTGTLGTDRGMILKNAAAGRYDISFLRKFKNIRFLGGGVTTNGSGALGNTAGTQVNNRIGAGLTAGADVTLQASNAAGTDTDVTSGNLIYFCFSGQQL